MSAKKWFFGLFAAVGLIAVLIALFNFVCDPFGVFGDRFTDKPSFNMTNNPKTAKLSYIDENHESYNAYVFGSSGTSSFSVTKLNEYTGLSWYNMFNYGADMAYTRKLAEYIISNYEVEHILLNLTLSNAEQYELPTTETTEKYPPQIAGSLSYANFLFANPRYSFEKLRNIANDTYLPQKFDVFVPETGCYDKSVRDIERIGSLEEYLELYPEFTGVYNLEPSLAYIDECIGAVAELKALCEANGIELTVVIPPMWEELLSYYDKDEVALLFQKLAELTGFFDFSASSISEDVRYFYDTTHFRNSAGDMMLAKVFGDGNAYVPDDFGMYIDKTNISDIVDDLWNIGESEESDRHEKDVPVIMYHHFADGGDPDTTMPVELFEEHIAALAEAGYTAIRLEELLDYVCSGTELPEKPIVITIDDGYLSNYEFAYPILEEYGFHATIFAIGVSVGKDTYKDTGEPIIPHFGPDEMAEMSASGVISIQSHTYDMHQSEKFDFPLRHGVLIMDDESEVDYIAAFREDFIRSSQQIEGATSETVFALSYPFGVYDKLPAALLREMGVKITLTSDVGVNTVVKGLPQSLLEMNRFTIRADMSANELLQMLAGA